MVPQWKDIPQAYRPRKYKDRKEMKRALKKARGNLKLRASILSQLNTLLKMAGYAAYANPGEPVPIPIPDGVYGPYTEGDTKYWIEKKKGVCYIWFDIDGDPDPDVRMKVSDFLADENNDVLLRKDVAEKAAELGC